jgi:hypothetical protein
MCHSKFLDHQKLIDVCKFGQGAECCAYIVGGFVSFECGKLDPLLRLQIDIRQDMGTMLAKGDNCLGHGIVLN